MQKITILGLFTCILLSGCLRYDPASLSEAEQIAAIVAQTQIAQTAEAVGSSNSSAEQQATTGPGDVPPVQAATDDAATQALPTKSSTRVNFKPGGTRLAIDGSVGVGEVNEYIVQVSSGQILQVILSPANGSVFLDIRGENGTNLIPDGAQWNSFWSSLPDTQDYKISVISAGAEQAYSINIIIPAIMTFGTGQTSQSISGHVGEYARVDYLFYARGGQEIQLSVTTPSVQVALNVTGMNDGQPYLRYVSEATDWTFTLPTMQYYMISVVTIGPATDFTLNVIIAE